MNGRFFHRTHFLFGLERMFNEDVNRVSGMNFIQETHIMKVYSEQICCNSER